ncbi:hypothetical protein Ccrd_006546 [Cynara cardunculus var. scolymus]|uniref:Rab-GAP TBC domain-containing protein n=1 Tax=Cynara cardunculus var. scolymus TaxID=59895 RepID=A0A103XII9_CYNCS|nr:hypothetical protein Ccrd_006546 [Cynara cardunculus var. scolymus]
MVVTKKKPMKNTNSNLKDQDPKQGTTAIDNHLTTLDSRFNQTLLNVQGMLKGRSFPGKVLITRSDPMDATILHSPGIDRSPSTGSNKYEDGTNEDQVHRSKPDASTTANQLNSSMINPVNTSLEAPRFVMSTRATDTAKLMKFTKVLGGVTVILDKLRELAWSGVPPYLRPNVWRLLLGYAPPNSDRREGGLRRKRIEYFDCVAQYYDISDNERTDEEINMLRQIAVDCPRTVPDVNFFQQVQVQKSLERILYTWAIRHPASGYVQGINDLATPFLVVFLSEHLEGNVDSWSIADLDPDKISNVEADCYWCLSKLLDGMQDHYTFAQPGIQRLVFKLKELEMVMFLQHLPTQNWGDQELEMVLSRAFMWHTMFDSCPNHLLSFLNML